MMSELNEVKDRTLTIERTFEAPIALVWEAWTTPEHIAQWWGPKGMAVNVVKHEFRVGGHWHYTMPMPDGSTFISEGVYKAIVPMEKIVTTADFKPMTEGVVIHVHFAADGDKTQFSFHVVHPTVAYCAQQEAMGFYNGWGGIMDNLSHHVEKAMPQGQ